MQEAGAKSPRQYFKYRKSVPVDPSSIYGEYGKLESAAPTMSLALYEGLEAALGSLIKGSPDLRNYLGNHANVGGLHWHSWNAIKNEAVGHSSLNLTYDLAKATSGRRATAQDVDTLIKEGTYYTEGGETNESIARFTMERGRPSVTRRKRTTDGQQ